MKKNLLYLFILICSVSLFTSCGDDDENDDNKANVAGTYAGNRSYYQRSRTDIFVAEY